MLFFCSVIAQCSSTPDTDHPISLTLGLVLRAKWATPAECFRCTVKSLIASRLGSYNSSAHSMSQISVPVWLFCHPVTALRSPSPCSVLVTFLVDRRQFFFFLTRVDYIAKSHRPTIERGQPWPSAHPGSVAKWRQQLEVKKKKKKQYMRNWKRELDSNLYESEVMKCRKSIREVKDIGRKSRAERDKDSSIKKSFINI